MAQSTIELISSEIERLKKEKFGFDDWLLGYETACDDILSFINTLEEPSLPSDLDEAAEKYAVKHESHDIYDCFGNPESDTIGKILAFMAGAKWDAQQGYLTERALQGRNAIENLDMDALMEKGITWGDKVIVQIRKQR